MLYLSSCKADVPLALRMTPESDIKSVLCNCAVRCFFFLPKQSKNLDPFDKMDLDFWAVLKGKSFILKPNK